MEVDLIGNGQVVKKASSQGFSMAIEVLREGHGACPVAGDRVTVHYACRVGDKLLDESKGWISSSD